MSDPVLVKQFGLQRSGVGFLRHLLLHNFHERVDLLGYGTLGYRTTAPSLDDMHAWLRQHSECIGLQFVFEKIRFVVSVRDPYTWAAEFMAYQTSHPAGYKLGKPREYGRLVTEVLNPQYRSWKQLCQEHEDRAVFVRYEDLCESYKEPLVEMAFRIGLEFNGNKFENISKRALSNGKLSKKKMIFRTTELKPGARKWITRKVDWDAAGYFGYKP